MVKAWNLASALFDGHRQLLKDLERPNEPVIPIFALCVNYNFILISANFEVGSIKLNGMHREDRTLFSWDSLEMM